MDTIEMENVNGNIHELSKGLMDHMKKTNIKEVNAEMEMSGPYKGFTITLVIKKQEAQA